jgi:hypothetical protein
MLTGMMGLSSAMLRVGMRDYTKSAVRRPPAFPNIIPSLHDPGNVTLRITPLHPSGDEVTGRPATARPEPPRSEPEIIPPGAEFPRRPDGETGFYTHRGIHIRVTPPGPLGIAAIVVGAGIVGVLSFVMLLGTLLIGAAAAGTIVLIALIGRLLRIFGRP